MSDIDNDPLLRRAVHDLRRLPTVDGDAVRRVVAAAAGARVRSTDEPAVIGVPGRKPVRLLSIGVIAGAAGIVGFMVHAWLPVRPAAGRNPVVPSSEIGAPLHDAANASEVMPLTHQFVFENAAARRVSVVGDFNRWNPRSAPMVRAANGVWSTVIPIPPGRHVYGFMIDDSLFRLDPREPKVRDPDLGTNGSVVLVGTP